MSNERKIEYSSFKVELDEKTSYSDHKKNRVSGYIKSIRVGRASSPNAVFKVRLKEGDEIILWPGRIINFSERSEGAVFSWDSLPNEWAEVEISENSFFVGGDSSGASGGGDSVSSEFRKTTYTLTNLSVVKILGSNDKRTKVVFYNNGVIPLFIGKDTEIDASISSALRSESTIKIMPFRKREMELSGELWAILMPGVSSGGLSCSIQVEEYLK